MAHLELQTSIRAPVEDCFDLARSIDVNLDAMRRHRERAVAGVTSGLIGLGQRVTWQGWHLGIRWRATSEITRCERPRVFVDEMRRGPFAAWRHEHHFASGRTVGGDATLMRDVVDFRAPLGPLGRLVDAVVLRRYLRALLARRNAHIKELAERANRRARA